MYNRRNDYSGGAIFIIVMALLFAVTLFTVDRILGPKPVAIQLLEKPVKPIASGEEPAAE